MSRPEILAVIPARGGSVRVPRKALRDLGGRPLIRWTIDAARSSLSLTRVVVSTEDPEIAAYCRRHDVETVPQPIESALAGTRSAPVVLAALDFLAAADDYAPEYVCLLHPTSPFRTGPDIDACVRVLLERDGLGSVLCYTNDVENGAVLLKRADAFRRDGSFMVGAPIWPYEMDERTGLDVNTWDDLERARAYVRGSAVA